MKIRSLFGRGIALFVFAVSLVFVFNACAGGAGGAIDEFTADGDYYNDGSSNQPVIVYGGGGTSGTGWVSNGSVSTSTDSKYKSDDILDLNDAINLAKDGVLYSADTKVNSALSDIDNLLRINPGWGDAKTVKEILERYLELKNNLIPSLEKEISSIEAKIAELTRQIAEQEKVVAEKKAIVDEKQKILDEYDKKLADLEGKIKAGLASDAEKAEYQRLLVEREQAFADWQAAMDAYNKALQKLNELIAEKEFYESLLATKKSLLEQYKQELEDLKQQITKIKSSGYKDTPYTQRWLVKDGTNIYDAYQDIIKYLKPNQKYRITGKFGSQYYYDEDEAYLTIAYGPSDDGVAQPVCSDKYYLITGFSKFGTSHDYGDYNTSVDSSNAYAYDGANLGAYATSRGTVYYGVMGNRGATNGTGSPTSYNGHGGFNRYGNIGSSGEMNSEWSSLAFYTYNDYLFRIECNRHSMNQTFRCQHRKYYLGEREYTRAPFYWRVNWENQTAYKEIVNMFPGRFNTINDKTKGNVNLIGNLPKIDIVLYANESQYIQASDTD